MFIFDYISVLSMEENGCFMYNTVEYDNLLTKGVIIIELIRFALTGANIIPTVLLGLILMYWIIVIIGFLDLEFLDFDLDVEGSEAAGVISGFFVFLNVAELPFMLFFSILTLNFWILSMFLYYLPISPGGFLNGILLIPTFVLSMFVTKYETWPLKSIFKASEQQNKKVSPTVNDFCILRCDIDHGQMGQAEMKKDHGTIVINVVPDVDGESFSKGEEAFVRRKDMNKNIFYIRKLGGEKTWN